MKVVLFCHSILSDWNNENAHFQRGVATELAARGHSVTVFEPEDAWSAQSLVADAGASALEESRVAYPHFEVRRYTPAAPDIEPALDGAGLVIVHERNSPALVARIGRHRARGGRYRLLFHDTHHRAVSSPEEMRRYDLSAYDAVLTFGEVLRQRYQEFGWGSRAFVWHQAADTRIFHPHARTAAEGELVWIGNWGDEERFKELSAFLSSCVDRLSLRARVYGVGYPEGARHELGKVGIESAGWLPNYRVPEVFGRFRVTIHVPRRAYAESLIGIPTIRPFEAMACGIPLVSAPWHDVEGLFRAGCDYLVVRDGSEMARMVRSVLHDTDLAQALTHNGRETILSRHTCSHRVDELLQICRVIGVSSSVVARRLVPAMTHPVMDRPRGEPRDVHATLVASDASDEVPHARVVGGSP